MSWVVARRVSSFRCASASGNLVNKIAFTFVEGVRETLACRDTSASHAHHISTSEEFLKPFFVEGAALALAAAKAMPFAKSCASPAELIDQLPGYKHVIYAGWGWWNALRPRPGAGIRKLEKSHELFSPLMIDGTAFARAFLLSRPPRFKVGLPDMPLEKQRIWAQGYGRALWFLAGSDPLLIDRHRERLGAKLAADLDAGLGLASGFAGLALQNAPITINDSAHRAAFLQGHAFGLTARAMSTPQVFSNWLGTQTPETQHNIRRRVARCLIEPKTDGDCPARVYTKWQDALRAEFEKAEVVGW